MQIIAGATVIMSDRDYAISSGGWEELKGDGRSLRGGRSSRGWEELKGGWEELKGGMGGA